MAGLLELFGVSSGDPSKDAAINQGIMQAGLTLMQARGRLGPALGQAGQAGMMGFQQAMQQDYQSKLQKSQLDEIARKKLMNDREESFIQGLPSPQQQANTTAYKASGAPLGTVAAAAAQPPVDPMQQLMHGAVKAGVLPLGTYLSSMQKDESPISVKEGESLLNRKTLQPVYTAPKSATPTEITKLMQERDSLQPGDPRRATYDDAIRKASTHTPGVSVNVNTAKPLLNTVAEGLGKQIDASLGEARAATSAVGTAHQLKAAIDSGKVISGPGATFKIFGLQLGQTFGVGGKNAQEVLGNTRSAVQAMAKAELDAAQQMKGQGQITEAERDIIRRAASGNVDSLTGPEMRLLADSMEKTARYKIKSHQRNLQGLTKMPGAEPLLPFYNVDEPPAYTAPAANRVRRYNPATGKLED